MDDAQIIELFFERSETAITQTQEKYGRASLAVARRILPDTRDAEECVSDACLRLWRSIPPEKPRSLYAYLMRITRNLALDRLSYHTAEKRDTALESAFEELEACLPAGVDVTEQAEFRRILNNFLRSQPRSARIYFIRRYWYGESIREIAQACRCGEEKIKSSLFRTRNRLRDALEKEGITV